jgi:hypothetical protein
MLQVYVKCFRCFIYTCKCFLRMLYMFAMATHVFSWCFRCMLQVFELFRTYIASVSSRCCKSRFSVAHVAIGPTSHSRLLQLLGVTSQCGRLRPADASAAHIHRQGKWLDPHGHRRASTQERRGAGETEWRGAVPPVRANRAYSQGVQQAPSDASAPDRTSRR